MLHLQLPLTVWAGCVAIDILPNDVLLIIFYFDGLKNVDPSSWHRLVHVCRRWRSVVFASPNFLNLELICDPRTHVELIDIWPPFPIIIKHTGRIGLPIPDDYDFYVVIVHRSRVRDIDLCLSSSWHILRLASAMQEPFPVLKHLKLDSVFNVQALPDGFLGGSAPRLQSLRLTSIPFPALPKLLLSANDLVRLTLLNISHSGYISPQAIVTGLAKSVNLKFLTIQFQSFQSHPDPERQHPPLPIGSIPAVLSSLTSFEFQGVTEYLEDLVARIDAPLLDSVCIHLFNDQIFDFSQLGRFMGHTARFQKLNQARVAFDYEDVKVKFLPSTRILDVRSELGISREFSEWEMISSLARALTSFLPSVHTVEHLYISFPGAYLPDFLKSVQWLELFRPFTAVRNLYLCKGIGQCIVPAMQVLIGRSVAGVLPALERIFLEVGPSGPDEDTVGHLVAARQLSGHPVAVSHWDRTLETFT